MPLRPFHQVDVFAEKPLTGNPLAVVADADDLSTYAMQRFAQWTNLSETVFLQSAKTPEADYTLRIFTPTQELPFAGHPTLGAAAVWRARGGIPQGPDIIQHCAGGLIPIREGDARLFFKAPPLIRTGPVPEKEYTRILQALSLTKAQVRDHAYVDNGPGWCALLLHTLTDLQNVVPNYAALQGQRVGLVAFTGQQSPHISLRAFSASGFEDPVTGSLNAGVAQWLRDTGRVSGRWVASQGEAVGRAGRVYLQTNADALWVGGAVQQLVQGTVAL